MMMMSYLFAIVIYINHVEHLFNYFFRLYIMHTWKYPTFKQCFKLLLLFLFLYSHISSKHLKFEYLNIFIYIWICRVLFTWLALMKLKEKELNCTLDAHTYLNLFTSSRCCQMGEKFPMTFISIRENEWRINVSMRMYSHTYIHRHSFDWKWSKNSGML
jgi:hypothetical protein